jgi:hypothetical protein
MLTAATTLTLLAVGGRSLTEREMWAARGAANDMCVDDADDYCGINASWECSDKTDDGPIECRAWGRQDAGTQTEEEFWKCYESSGLDCDTDVPASCYIRWRCEWDGGDPEDPDDNHCVIDPALFEFQHFAYTAENINGNPCPP